LFRFYRAAFLAYYPFASKEQIHNKPGFMLEVGEINEKSLNRFAVLFIYRS
jgi:hypothetical protein